MVLEYSLPRISFISSYIITNKTLILYFVNGDRHIFREKNPHVVGKIEMNTVIVNQT